MNKTTSIPLLYQHVSGVTLHSVLSKIKQQAFHCCVNKREMCLESLGGNHFQIWGMIFLRGNFTFLLSKIKQVKHSTAVSTCVGSHFTLVCSAQ